MSLPGSKVEEKILVNAQEQVEGLLVHVGAGLIAPDSWINLDGSWNAWLAKVPRIRAFFAALGVIPQKTAAAPWSRNLVIHDVRKGLPFPDGSAAAVYASHLIEHLTYPGAREFVRECHRVLKSGGRIRLITPDLEFLATRYIAEKQKPDGSKDVPATRFLKETGIIQDFGGTSPLTRLYRAWKSYEVHKWLYDADSLAALLEEGGFSEPARRGYLESGIRRVADVEAADRLQGAICVEAVKK